jgi:DNA-binding NarL/FixJ family response regulator
LHAQYPAFRPHEIATICFVKFNRKPAPATIKLILASGPKPSTTERRYPHYAEIEDGAERRRTVIRLHADGWNAKSIAEYLQVSRKTVHAILRHFAEELRLVVQPDDEIAMAEHGLWVASLCNRF